MIPKVGIVVLCVAVGLYAIACGGDDSGSGTVAATPLAPADVIRETERERVRALVARDLETARRLHGDDFELTTPVGEKLTKDEYLDAVGSGRLDYVVWELISPIKVNVRGDKAVIRYRSKIGFAGNFGGTTEQSHKDVYERRNGDWLIVKSETSF